jgi:hypothetical protein
MSEWLTTGQMIDSLEDEEIAESIDGEYKAYWQNGCLRFCDRHGDVQERIVKSDQKRKWRILPRYVSFEKAMNAFKKGKKVYFHGVGDYTLDEGVELPPKGMNISNSLLKEWNPYSLYIGKWTIED